jgi:hypothetical protein
MVLENVSPIEWVLTTPFVPMPRSTTTWVPFKTSVTTTISGLVSPPGGRTVAPYRWPVVGCGSGGLPVVEVRLHVSVVPGVGVVEIGAASVVEPASAKIHVVIERSPSQPELTPWPQS